MTSDSFIDICERSFSDGKVKLGQMQRAIYMEKLMRFTPPQMDKIFEKILETVKRFPKIAEIYDVARDLGYLQSETPAFKAHTWKPTDCSMCRGEGRIGIIWKVTIEPHATGLKEISELSEVFPYSEAVYHPLKTSHYLSVYRCKCPQGDVDTLPKAWPKWTATSEPRREVWV